MPQGLQIFDSLGRTIVDVSDWLGRLIGSVSVTAFTGGSVTNDLITSGTPFFIWIPTSEEAVTGPSYIPSVTFSGNVMTWGVNPISGTIIYGVR